MPTPAGACVCLLTCLVLRARMHACRDSVADDNYTLLARHEALSEWPMGVPAMPDALAQWWSA